MNRKISVIIKEPGKNPRHVNISTSHENLRNIVGGDDSQIILCSNVVLIFNAQQEGLAPCCKVCGKSLAGPVIFCGIGHPDEEAADILVDLPIDFKTFKKMFPTLWDE